MLRAHALALLLAAFAQNPSATAGAQAAAGVSAELTKGKLNPATSKPGDEIAVRLQEDLKANGQVLLKKGSTIRGVVRNVRRAEGKAAAGAAASAQSMIELQWIAPTLSAGASQHLNLALQSIVYTNPLYAHSQASADSGFDVPRAGLPVRSSGGGGLVGGGAGLAGGVAGSTTLSGGVASAPVGLSTGIAAQTSSGVAAPAVIVPASAQTSASLQSNFGVSGNSLYVVGSGQATSSGGTTTSMDLFSHLSNDTVITSPSRDFEISSGAQMQLLVR